ALYECDDNVLRTPRNWSANGVPGGNGTVGRVTAGTPATEATYTAPHSIPPANPVAVSVQIPSGSANTVLVSSVTVSAWGWVGGAEVFHSYGTRDPNEGEWYHFTNVVWKNFTGTITIDSIAQAGFTMYRPIGGLVAVDFVSDDCTIILSPNTQSLATGPLLGA